MHGQTVNALTANVTGSAPAGGSFGMLVVAEPACLHHTSLQWKSVAAIRVNIAHGGQPPVLSESESQTDIVGRRPRSGGAACGLVRRTAS
jgi:hypothetical protein